MRKTSRRDGVSSAEKKLTQEECITYLRLASQELGVNFTRKMYTERQKENHNFPKPGRISRLFGGWAAAMEAAGLIPGMGGRQWWSDEEMLDFLRRAAEEMRRDNN